MVDDGFTKLLQLKIVTVIVHYITLSVLTSEAQQALAALRFQNNQHKT
jgi:hypothetical protein